MITEIQVENMAIIERTRLELGSGFTALTGETGAGKSLLIDAIELVLGQRADVELVRTGAAKAQVQAVFDLSARPEIILRLAEFGIEPEDGLLYIQREVVAEGRSAARVNGRACPVGTLKAVGALLVDLHGQHDHQALLDPERHLAYLDSWIGPEAVPVRSEYDEALSRFREAASRLRSFRSNVRDFEQRLDLLRFQQKEISQTAPTVGEFEDLENLAQRLKYAERLAEGMFMALGALADGDANATDGIGTASVAIRGLTRFDDSLEGLAARIEAAQAEVAEITYALRDYAVDLDAEPGRLEEVIDRLDALKRLRRKYGADEAAVLEHLAAVEQQLAELEQAEHSEETLVQNERLARKRLAGAAEVLTSLRVSRGAEFAAIVAEQLRDLGMERARFSVKRNPKEPDESGADEMTFLFSANAGEELKPLNKIASGGEMSRVMLAIKTALAGRAGVPTLIFDEVDAGLGGRTAAIVARKLAELAQHYQVVVISHSPQIASRAVSHFRISKDEVGGRVVTSVTGLAPQERELEVARMLAGENVTDSALQIARELLDAKHPSR